MYTKLVTGVAFAFVCSSGLAQACELTRVNVLVDTGMKDSRSGCAATARAPNGITLPGCYGTAEGSFQEASQLCPDLVELRFYIATTEINQAIASSGAFRQKLAEARRTYEDIVLHDPKSFDAQTWLAALASADSDKLSAARTFGAMTKLDPVRSEAYQARFVRAEQILGERINLNVPKTSDHTVIVVLGYALTKKGRGDAKLFERLRVAAKTAALNPTARIIVSGGQVQAGHTEADVMAAWLIERRIERSRIVIEDASRDTVGNALNVAQLLKQFATDHVILITSASHMRRARTLFEEALRQSGIAAPVTPVAAPDIPRLEMAKTVGPRERLSVFRDLLRVSGLWAYPGQEQ
jgi:uncharacterized SAM-binding protein YcdF (DUF218 family)